MLFNLASLIIINLLFYGIDVRLRKLINARRFAYSPVMDCSPRSVQIQMIFCLQTSVKKIDIQISINNFSQNEIALLNQFFNEIIHDLTTIFCVIFKNNFTFRFEYHHHKTIYTTQFKELVISIDDPDEEKNIHIFLPFQFFSFFSITITPSTSSMAIETAVINFFRNPVWMLPDIQYLFNALSISELTMVINDLQKNNLLTPYQIFLIINAYPELSGTLKSALSQNIINDVIRIKKEKKIKIDKRDIAGGIYSIEESLYMLMRNGIDLTYSTVLNHIQHLVQLSLNVDQVMKLNFNTWLSKIQSDDLLHATISMTGDSVVSAAISRDPDSYMTILENNITERKIEDIKKVLNPAISFDEIMKARIALVSNYRKLRMKRIQTHPDRFAYLLSSFTNPNDYQYLLFSVGWFTLSTALKGLHQKLIYSVLGHLPFSAGILIEDVLQGIVNPNILHDEIQINKARIHCVSSIMHLYNDGLINLDLGR